MVLLGALGVWLLPAIAPCPGPRAQQPDSASENSASENSASGNSAPAKIDPTSVNATCYVCHMTFVREGISKVHFREKVTCIKCHGLSAAHANDEDIGATKPDVVYRRDQVNAMCGECHQEHDVAAAKVIARFVERDLALQPPPVCTDCHGEHKIEPSEASSAE